MNEAGVGMPNLTKFDKSSLMSSIATLDRRADEVRRVMERSTLSKITSFWEQLDLSAIYHDCALEGQVVSPDELEAAFNAHSVADVATLPLYTSLRSHKTALELIRELAGRSRLDWDIALFKRFHALFAPDPDEGKAGRFRKDIPLHRSYFHEIAEPQKIPAAMRKLVDWLADPTDPEDEHPVLFAAKLHYRFMRIFPFSDTSGKVGRAVMNLLLVRHGYLPAIIHATERQRYYESLRQQENGLEELIVDSAQASLEAAMRFLSDAVAS